MDKQLLPVEQNEAMFKFISQVINMAKDKEVFSQIHLKDVDSELYMKEMKHVTDMKPTELYVRKKVYELEAALFEEKSKKKPNLTKIKKLSTMYRVYSDTLDFMMSYIDMRFYKIASLLDKALRRLGYEPEADAR